MAWRSCIGVLLGCVLGVAVAANADGAARTARVTAPHSGAWKLLLLSEPSPGVAVSGGKIGGFRLTTRHTITGMHVTFSEDVQTAGCAGGSVQAPASETITVYPTPRIAVTLSSGAWRAGSASRPLAVGISEAGGARVPGQLSIRLTGRRPLLGRVVWNGGACTIPVAAERG